MPVRKGSRVEARAVPVPGRLKTVRSRWASPFSETDPHAVQPRDKEPDAHRDKSKRRAAASSAAPGPPSAVSLASLRLRALRAPFQPIYGQRAEGVRTFNLELMPR